MTTDDIHDLFASNEADESDASEEADERTDEWDASAGLTDEQPSEDEGPVEPAASIWEEPAESEPAAVDDSPEDGAEGSEIAEPERTTGDALEGDPDGFEMAAATTASSGGSLDDDAEAVESDDSTTMSFEGSPDDNSREHEPVESRVADEDDLRDPEPAGSTVATDYETQGGSEFEAVGSTTATSRPIEDDAPESEPAESGSLDESSADRGADRGRDTGGSTRQGRDFSGEPAEDGAGELASAETTVAPDEAIVGESAGSEPDGGSANLDERSGGGQATAESVGSSTPAIRPIEDDRDEFGAGSGSMASGSAVGEGDSTASIGSGRLSTGIDVLDRAMGGGIPPGRLVLLVADPGVQSELIVDSILAQRDTLYVTTDRPDWEVMKDIEPGLGSGEVVVREHTPDSLLSGVDLLLDELGTSSNLVLDSVNELELLPRQRYRIFLSDLKRRVFETGSLGLLTGVTVGHESARDLTLRRADIVLQLETRTTDREIENRLSVPKFRGGAALTETVKLELTDEVTVDPEWNDG